MIFYFYSTFTFLCSTGRMCHYHVWRDIACYIQECS